MTTVDIFVAGDRWSPSTPCTWLSAGITSRRALDVAPGNEGMAAQAEIKFY